ncbi:MAG: superoxide dismutase [Acidimicrobiales bacterium]
MIAGAAMLAVPSPASAFPFPEVIDLPPGWQPEGIASGRGTTVYSGSRVSGDIVAVDVLTGRLDLAVDAPAGRMAIGIEQDRYGRFWVAGGEAGDVYVYDENGDELAVYDFADTPTFVNDVVVTRDAAWFTDSQRPVLYKVPIARDGSLGEGEVVPLTGDYEHVAGFNLNGIDASRDGRFLFAVQSSTGVLYNIDPDTGEATRIDLGGATVVNGDGIYLEGRRLYVVQNRFNQVAVVVLDRFFTSGEVVDELTSDNFDVPTTMTRFGSRFYLVNARFGTAGEEPAEYWITAIPRR